MDVPSDMSVFTAGGPTSGLIRRVYGQIRQSFDHNSEILNAVKQIATASGHIPHINSGSDDTQSPTHLSMIEAQYEQLRIAFNRLYFIECNWKHFDDPNIRKEAVDDYKNAKALLEFREDDMPIGHPMEHFIKQVKLLLEARRFFLCVAGSIQELFSFPRLQVSFLIFGIQLVARRGIYNVDMQYSRLKMSR